MSSAAPRLYPYVGPEAIRLRCAGAPVGFSPDAAGLDAWLAASGPRPGPDGRVALTFVVSADGRLRLADRHSEHVACAGGQPVRAAGELFLVREGGAWVVVEVSNQSTGYCPEPDCWPEVARALEAVGLTHPGAFTLALVFRLCEACGERNVVRDGWFVCAACGADLPSEWNFAPPSGKGPPGAP